MLRLYLVCAIFFCPALLAQTTSNNGSDPFRNLSFLEGTWDANVQNIAAVTESGRYTFQRELNGHILARHATNDSTCKAPANYDCAHSDLLYVFPDTSAGGLKAIYFDNEGHVIHYDVSTPEPGGVVFLSEPGPGPQFRLAYELRAGVMTGRFQMKMRGQGDWHTYLEWSGGHQ